jgi:hypothetical protein
MEEALYNGINAGMSVDGTNYLYRNPLAFDPQSIDQARNVRSSWYDTTCCPPNLQRTFASLPGYFYSTSPEGIYVHLFHSSKLDWHLADGTPVTLTQKTEYPWKGAVQIRVTPTERKSFTLFIRIPGWAKGARLAVEGREMAGVPPGGYLAIRRAWKPGESLILQMPMEPQLVEANPRVISDNGKVAIRRGPVLYCIEQIDQHRDIEFDNLRVSLQGGFQSEYMPNLLGGAVRLTHTGRLEQVQASSPLYETVTSERFRSAPVPITFIPYFAWGNRAKSQMQVWTLAART